MIFASPMTARASTPLLVAACCTESEIGGRDTTVAALV
jgi:hypothetical protein